MKIKILQDSGRRCAWTDRKDGYFELSCSKEIGNSGYHRVNTTLFSGFSVGGHPFNQAKNIEVFPEGFVLNYDSAGSSSGSGSGFGTGSGIAGSLLLSEQAFWIGRAKNFGIFGLNFNFPNEIPSVNAISDHYAEIRNENGEYSVDGHGSMPEAESNSMVSGEGASGGKREREPVYLKNNPEWKLFEKDGVYVLDSGLGVAIAAGFDFYYKAETTSVELYERNSDEKLIEKYEQLRKAGLFPCSAIQTAGTSGEDAASGTSSKDGVASGWYIVFEKNPGCAVEKAVRLVKENAVAAHCTTIHNFLDKCQLDTGDTNFNQAVQWARFSAWLLATKDHDSNYRGIWAGLPWFRDNWGRDTFISLCGTLLVSGCFDEARDVLLGFAGFQNLNPKTKTYGRIPNRYRNAEDVIYNTADGTLWFIRALWEYVQYSGDTSVLSELSKTVEIALDADISRSDGNGFLKHGDADTWMDARIAGKDPWSPRGDRANDIQALWYTALKLGAKIMKLSGKNDKANVYSSMADKVRTSFTNFFWNADCRALADHLPEGGYGEWAKDMRVRPNQLFAITVPSVLSDGDENFISEEITKNVMENVYRELVNPFGLYSLSPEDPIFHGEHENPSLYNKDAAYHNGTIWEWNSGPYISACAQNCGGTLPAQASAILQNEAKMILEFGCAGSLSENIHARPDEEGNPKLSGTFSQAWSVAEYARNILQDVVGFEPRLAEDALRLHPCLPADCHQWKATLPFGRGWALSVEIKRKGKNYECTAEWLTDEPYASLPELSLNGQKLEPGKPVSFKTPAKEKKHSASRMEANHVVENFGVPAKWITEPFAKHNLFTEWNGADRIENYLEKLILSGRMKSKTSGGENTAALEWYFDSASFKNDYVLGALNVELGALYSKRSTVFRIWAPTARSVSVLLYSDGDPEKQKNPEKSVVLKRLSEPGFTGIWEAEVKGDLHGTYYEYELLIHGVYNHSADPYAHACGINGLRSMVVDMSRTNPEGWEKTGAPAVKNPSNAIVWEAHVADLTSGEFWNGSSDKKRLYTGVKETGTTCDGQPTGFDYIKSLGITHVQFLPVFDFRSVDERRARDKDYIEKPTFGAFNWGYDPENYGVPEGSYSSDPYHGEVRIREFKEMVQAFNQEGIGVVMDVVFNHVNDGLHQALGVCVPGYFFRVEGYSGAGEDTASEHEMFRKYMADTLCFWLKEYKLSGFRFDLMGLHDVDTMNYCEAALRKIKKDVLIYGEGWQMYNAGKMTPASMCNAYKMPGIGHFNDAVRCGIKGPVFSDTEPGYIHNGNRREAIKFGITGATLHPQMDFSKIEGTANPNPWTQSTWTSINYTEIHDNITLNDKLRLVEPGKPEEYYQQLVKMAISLVMLSEGMPILHAGMEFMRSKEIPQDILNSGATFYDVATAPDGKSYLRNSYNACDRINALNWKQAAEKKELVDYVRKLIELRKAHPAFRIASGKTCAEALTFLDNKEYKLPEQLIIWQINGKTAGDKWKTILLCANPLNEEIPFALPALSSDKEKWTLITDGVNFTDSAADSGDTVFAAGGKVSLKPKTVTVFAIK